MGVQIQVPSGEDSLTNKVGCDREPSASAGVAPKRRGLAAFSIARRFVVFGSFVLVPRASVFVLSASIESKGIE